MKGYCPVCWKEIDETEYDVTYDRCVNCVRDMRELTMHFSKTAMNLIKRGSVKSMKEILKDNPRLNMDQRKEILREIDKRCRLRKELEEKPRDAPKRIPDSRREPLI